MRHYQVDCYLLHLRQYRETSVIATAFSKELGKVSFVVKGVRNKKQLAAGLLQSFVPLQLQLHGQSELKNGNKIEMLGKSFHLSGKHLYSGMYLNELLIRTLPVEEPFSDIYDSYSEVVSALANGDAIEPILRCFEFQLLQNLGYGIDFTYDAETQSAINPELHYLFHPERGFTNVSASHSNKLHGTAILQVAEQNWTQAALITAKYISRSALAPLLGHKPLKSRELFR